MMRREKRTLSKDEIDSSLSNLQDASRLLTNTRATCVSDDDILNSICGAEIGIEELRMKLLAYRTRLTRAALKILCERVKKTKRRGR